MADHMTSEKIDFTKRWIRWEVVGLALLVGWLLGDRLFGSNMKATGFGIAVAAAAAVSWAVWRQSRQRA